MKDKQSLSKQKQSLPLGGRKIGKEKKTADIEGLKNQLARALADYDNLRKRTEEEKATWIKFATGKFIQGLLPILDTFENAQKHLGDQGLAIGISEFRNLLKDEGLVEIKPNKGDTFDANLCEAIEVVEGKEENGRIAEVVLPGWKFSEGPVVRYARVKVYKAGLSSDAGQKKS